MYHFFLKPFMFLLPPEKAHHLTLFGLKIVLNTPIVSSLFRTLFRLENEKLKQTFLNLSFENPVGLAAGFDKDGKYIPLMDSLGFGFIEVGTVTPKPQIGNAKPRLFRLPKDEALINRMGFNNEGVDNLVENLKKKRPKNLIIGGNIGKNKNTANENAIDDYAYCFEKLFDVVDYFVVNVSSPNTPNLRHLQAKKPLTKLLTHLQVLNNRKTTPKPILLKIAPDLSFSQLDDILDIVAQTKISGIVATNTTVSREGLQTAKKEVEKMGNGGLSGTALRLSSLEIVRYLSEKTDGKLFIIGVGGIAKPKDALEMLEAGASLLQVYTGLIYEGPMMVKNIKQALLKKS
ncbi:MAG: quinone-dependent dihydroorotate dehydrogenase [Chitinophagales bacterium]